MAQVGGPSASESGRIAEKFLYVTALGVALLCQLHVCNYLWKLYASNALQLSEWMIPAFLILPAVGAVALRRVLRKAVREGRVDEYLVWRIMTFYEMALLLLCVGITEIVRRYI